jgi:hypothetical protein
MKENDECTGTVPFVVGFGFEEVKQMRWQQGLEKKLEEER